MSTEIKPEAIRDQDEAISLSYWLAEKMGEHVDDQGDETLTETVQRYVSREWMPKTGATPAPAPLDPSADDALAASLQRLGKVWGEYRDQQVRGAAKALDVVAASIQQVVDAANAVHQPASEPEPEWKPGMTGTATVAHLAGGTAVLDMRVMRVEWDGLLGFATQTGRIIEDGSTEWSVYDLVPDEPRPLPTREQVAEAIMTTDKTTGNYGLYPDVATKAADAVLELLRGESR